MMLRNVQKVGILGPLISHLLGFQAQVSVVKLIHISNIQEALSLLFSSQESSC